MLFLRLIPPTLLCVLALVGALVVVAVFTYDPTAPPSSPSQRVLIEDSNHLASPKIVALGTSVTHGSGLVERGTQTYPALLGGRNLGTPSQGPSFMAQCVSSYLSEEEGGRVDVVVIEYFGRIQTGYQTRELALRLRRRFPDAALIFLRDWFPLNARVAGPGGATMQEWMRQNGLRRDRTDYFKNGPFTEAILKSDVEWEWSDIPGGTEIHDETVAEVGGHVLRMPAPPSVKEMWTKVPSGDGYAYADLIGPDLIHWSAKGHIVMADMIHDLIDTLDLPSEPRLGDWDHVNVCNNWMLNPEESPEHSDNVNLLVYNSAKEKGRLTKWALEFPQEGGNMTLHNPTEDSLNLHLSILITGPPPSKYPGANITIHSGIGATRVAPQTTVFEQPAKSSRTYNFHITKMVHVGTAHPGENIVQVQPLGASELPFRVTATAMIHPTAGEFHQEIGIW